VNSMVIVCVCVCVCVCLSLCLCVCLSVCVLLHISVAVSFFMLWQLCLIFFGVFDQTVSAPALLCGLLADLFVVLMINHATSQYGTVYHQKAIPEHWEVLKSVDCPGTVVKVCFCFFVCIYMYLCVCVSVCDIMCKIVCVIKIWKEGCREAGGINRWLLFVVKMGQRMMFSSKAARNL